MIRNIKALGLAVFAVMAMSAVVASAASAANFTINNGEYPAAVSGTQTNENVLSNGVRSVTCKTSTFTGTLTAPSETILITPVYVGCTGNGGIPATFTTNGCRYDLTFTSVTGSEFTGHTKLDCPGPTKHMSIDYYANHANHTAGTKLCEHQIPEEGNSAINGVAGSSEGAGETAHIGLTSASNNIRILRTVGSAANCGVAEQKAGTYNGKADYTAKNKAGSNGGLMVG